VTRLPAKPGFSALSHSVGFEGDALRLLVRSDLAHVAFGREESPGFASFPLTRAEEEYHALLEVTGPSGTYEIGLKDLSDTFPLVQLLPGGNPLVVSTRSRRYGDGTHEFNARIYDTQGVLRADLLLGDGIQHLQTDKRGNIWVGYFDEGVYGNFGWGGSGDAGPVGASGLLCFNARGEKLWEYQPVSGTDSISDVYALNVFGDEAWAYYYTDFPLVRIGGDRRVEAWTTDTAGARAFAVGELDVLLFGGYGENRTAAKWLRLTDHKARTEQDVSLSLTDGGNLAEATVTGRGHILHVFAGDLWYQFSTNSLP
jgi:hypothetical protein